MVDLTYNALNNPHLGPVGTACMHGDAQSSDCTPLPGPGVGPWEIQTIDLGGACPTVMVGSDGFIQVLCTQRFGSGLEFLQPKVYLLDPRTSEITGSCEVPKGALLGGVYAFLDEQDRMVFVDGTNHLIRVAHSRDGSRVFVDSRTSIEGLLSLHPGDQIVGVVPDWFGRVWVASQRGLVAVIAHEGSTVTVRSTILNQGNAEEESVDNSISACPEGIAVVTSHALYVLNAAEDHRPEILWSQPYDRGSARKPGKLSWGSGASPTFFGPQGHDYVMISDNADEQDNLLVFDTLDGRLIGQAGLFTPGSSGTECSAVGVNNSILVSNTYGYPYPRYPENAGPSVPESAPFAPGLEHWIVGEQGLELVWKRDDIYCSVVPRLSTADGLIYLCERKPSGHRDGSRIKAAIVDVASGETLYEQNIPGLVTVFGVDTLQMVGTIDAMGTWWQGTIGGVVKIFKKQN